MEISVAFLLQNYHFFVSCYVGWYSQIIETIAEDVYLLDYFYIPRRDFSKKYLKNLDM